MSVRRRARARTPVPVEAGGPPPGLYDADDAVWHNPSLYAAFMAAHGWSPGASQRVGRPTHPANRRNHAASQWARQNGVIRDGSADWHRLRAMRLIAGPREEQ